MSTLLAQLGGNQTVMLHHFHNIDRLLNRHLHSCTTTDTTQHNNRSLPLQRYICKLLHHAMLPSTRRCSSYCNQPGCLLSSNRAINNTLQQRVTSQPVATMYPATRHIHRMLNTSSSMSIQQYKEQTSTLHNMTLKLQFTCHTMLAANKCLIVTATMKLHAQVHQARNTVLPCTCFSCYIEPWDWFT